MRSKKRFARTGNILTVILSAVCGFAAIFILIALFSLLMTRIDVNDSVVSVLTSAGLCAGAYIGGYVASKKRRQNGLIMGLICGLFMFGIIFLVSYLFAGTAGGFSASSKLVMTLLFASAGGIVGVNSSGRKFRRK